MTIEEIREALIQVVEQHKRECPLPPATCAEPCNMLAFLAHCAGMSSARIAEFRTQLMRYEAECVQCDHLRN